MMRFAAIKANQKSALACYSLSVLVSVLLKGTDVTALLTVHLVHAGAHKQYDQCHH